MSGMIKCAKPDCGIHFNPATSSDVCPHRSSGRTTPLLDGLAAKLKRGQPIKLESWKPAAHPHTGEIVAAETK